jgi:hypothetical protein
MDDGGSGISNGPPGWSGSEPGPRPASAAMSSKNGLRNGFEPRLMLRLKRLREVNKEVTTIEVSKRASIYMLFITGELKPD